jgi:hypothetical protein
VSKKRTEILLPQLMPMVTDHKYVSDACHGKGCQYLVLLQALEDIAETLDKFAPCPEEILDGLLATAQSAIRAAKGQAIHPDAVDRLGR